MLRPVKGIRGDRLRAKDGEIGHVDCILFDDQNWAVRYLVANTGDFLFGRQVLIARPSLIDVDWERHELDVNLTRGCKS
jgi:hypothetical protein